MKRFLILFACIAISFYSIAQNKAVHLSKLGQYYTCGKINITGKQLTVEALVKLDGTGPFHIGQSANDIVSKHHGANDINYLLRPDHCEITTSTGYYYSDINLSLFSKDSFYHVAMTYNGSFLRFYVNGCLFSEKPATGDLFQNDYETTIGQLASNPGVINDEQLFGYADEIRIWSVARTQQQIADHMRALPSPQTQAGLVAYYNFENGTENIQGNAAYNAKPFGAPEIKSQNGFTAVKKFAATAQVQEPSCGTPDGKITIHAAGGKGPYKYSLNGGAFQDDPVFTGLAQGTYQVTVQTSSLNTGCTESRSAILKTCEATPCNSWLKLGNQPSFVKVGDLDIAGNKITVEASFNRTVPWNGSDLFQGDLVSKHEGPQDCNYLLRPGSAEITTSNGYFKTPTICNIELNKTYHAALVYDGTMLKFYRNGFLMSQIPATGNLVQNDWQTQIGLYFNQITQEQFTGYINEVRIWNIARTQEQLRSFMNQSLSNPQNLSGLQAYYTFNNLVNKQGNSQWNGTLHGQAQVFQTNPSCTFVADSCKMLPCSDFAKPDFSFKQDLCNPGKFDFFTNPTAGISFKWSISNVPASSDHTASFNFTVPGTYQVKLEAKKSDNCIDSIVKNITYAITTNPLLNNRDTAICLGDSVALKYKNSLIQYCWKSTSNALPSLVQHKYFKPADNSTYSLTAIPYGTNLVSNPSFTSGNSSFSSSYQLNPGASQPGYRVSNTSSGWGNLTCNDFSGSGNMLLVKTSADKGKTIWKQQNIPVTPHTNYAFSISYLSLAEPDIPLLQLAINENPIDAGLESSTNSCVWKTRTILWNSGNLSTLSLSILSATEGNQLAHFAIDEIYFGKAEVQTTELKISVLPKPMLTLSGNTAICPGSSAQLSAETSIEPGNIRWTPAQSLSSNTGNKPVATPMISTWYTATVSNAIGCTSKDSLFVRVLPQPNINLVKTANLCTGSSLKLIPNGTHVATVSWSPTTGIDNPASLAPTFSPVVTTLYQATMTSTEGCSAIDSIQIQVNPLPTGMVQKENDIDCEQPFTRLFASGGTRYQWSPAMGLSNSNTANPIASPTQTTKYAVQVFNSFGCSIELPVEVKVVKEGLSKIYIPNAFTPNGDGLNDCFGLKQLTGATSFNLQVYNRWGQLVFAGKDPTQCWNGYFNGVAQPKGVYVYMIQAQTICGNIEKKGTIMLIR